MKNTTTHVCTLIAGVILGYAWHMHHAGGEATTILLWAITAAAAGVAGLIGLSMFAAWVRSIDEQVRGRRDEP